MSADLDMQDLLHFNGVQASSGDFGLSPMSSEQLSRFLLRQDPPENLDELQARHAQKHKKHYGVREGVDPKKLEESGWGVIFAHNAEKAIKDALKPLLDLRREQAGPRFKIYEHADGYRPGEAKSAFLSRHGAGPGPADPEKVPYYLLIVGGPETIPFRFQTQLDVQYAVGRIHFDHLEQYAGYAASVVGAERGELRLPRRASFFGVRNADDKATSMSYRRLTQPVREHLKEKHPDWQVNAFLREQADKANLTRLLGGDETPALLFTTSHGVEFRPTDTRQLQHQGAILCQDWPGPEAGKGTPLTQDVYFAGDDLSPDARLHGLICFSFACFGAGTPQYDEFSKQAFSDHQKEIAPRPFVAGLPKALLGHPEGGALAFVGHVERAWGYSFLWRGAGTQTAVFESALDRLLDGHTVGSAFEYFDQRYAELSTTLADYLEEADCGVEVDPYELAGMWTANNDARGYVVIGDPAVRLPVAQNDEPPTERQSLGELRSAAPTAAPAAIKTDSSTAPPGELRAVKRATCDPSASETPDIASVVGELDPEQRRSLTRLTVSTYRDEDPANPSSGRLCARTEFSFTGDVDVHVGTEADEALLTLHRHTVTEAVRARLAYWRLAMEQGEEEVVPSARKNAG